MNKYVKELLLLDLKQYPAFIEYDGELDPNSMLQYLENKEVERELRMEKEVETYKERIRELEKELSDEELMQERESHKNTLIELIRSQEELIDEGDEILKSINCAINEVKGVEFTQENIRTKMLDVLQKKKDTLVVDRVNNLRIVEATISKLGRLVAETPEDYLKYNLSSERAEQLYNLKLRVNRLEQKLKRMRHNKDSNKDIKEYLLKVKELSAESNGGTENE